MSKCVQITVNGRVQGVYFRAFTKKQANKHNITGYAKNLPNGDVEIIACGERNQIEQFVSWCHKGPALAKVSQVKTQQWSIEKPFEGFEVL